jgi:general transcription factor 3C polypeptide 5 (transcription factor C subunit 1)
MMTFVFDLTAMSSSPVLPSVSELIDQSVGIDEQAGGLHDLPADDQASTQPQLPPLQPPRRKLPTFNAIEYPGYISPNPTSLNRAIDTLGGHKYVQRAFGEGGKILELRLQPDNPFAHPVTGDVVGTNKLLVKVVTRKRKQIDGANDLGDGDPSSTSRTTGDKGKEKASTEEQSQGTYTAEVMGIIPKTVRFRSKSFMVCLSQRG